MARIFSYLMLFASVVVLFFQLFFFTIPIEQVTGSAVGLAVYGLVVFYVAPRHFHAPALIFSSVVAGLALGVLPPRLRLGGELHAFVLFFPALHSILIAGFLIIYRGHLSSRKGDLGT